MTEYAKKFEAVAIADNDRLKSVKQKCNETLRDVLRSGFSATRTRLLELHPIAELGYNTEGVHQYRVVLRRMTMLLGIVRTIAPFSEAKSLSAEAKWLLNELNDARALDVFLTETLPEVEESCSRPQAFDAIRNAAEEIRTLAYQRAHVALTDQRSTRFQVGISRLLEEEKWRREASPQGIQALLAPSKKFADKLLRRRRRRVLKLGRGFRALGNEERHQVRLAAKKLRYTLECFEQKHSRNGHRNKLLDRVSTLLDGLGELNDAVVTCQLVTKLSDSKSDPDLQHAAGFIEGYQTAYLAQRNTALWRAWRRFKNAPATWGE
ncbi:CHAD domain-containing protein [Rhizobium herbae]